MGFQDFGVHGLGSFGGWFVDCVASELPNGVKDFGKIGVYLCGAFFVLNDVSQSGARGCLAPSMSVNLGGFFEGVGLNEKIPNGPPLGISYAGGFK
jgi:hypothetical protein